MILLHVYVLDCPSNAQINYISCSENVRLLPKCTFELHYETDDWNTEAGQDRILKLLQLSFPQKFTPFR